MNLRKSMEEQMEGFERGKRKREMIQLYYFRKAKKIFKKNSQVCAWNSRKIQ